MALTAQQVIDGVRALHPAFHPTRVPNPPLLQAVGFAVRSYSERIARINPALVCLVATMTPAELIAGVTLPDALVVLDGDVTLAAGGYTPTVPLRIVDYGQRFGAINRYSAYQLGTTLAALGSITDWSEAVSISIPYVPVPAPPTALAGVVPLPDTALWPLVLRVGVTAATFAADDKGGTGDKASLAMLNPQAWEQRAVSAEDQWYSTLKIRRNMEPTVIREG